MKLARNPFLHAIRSGKPQIGLWLSLCSNFAADAVASAGFDWVALDMEHAHNDVATVLGQLQVFESVSTTAIVRPMWNEPVVVKRLMDLGAPGLIFPMVQNVAEAEQAVAAVRYPPRGIRGVAGMHRGSKFGRVKDYFEEVENQTAVIVQAETRDALDRIEEIASVDGVDGILFGPADIGASIGKLGQPTAPEVWELILPAAERVRNLGKPVGTLVTDAGRATELLNKRLWLCRLRHRPGAAGARGGQPAGRSARWHGIGACDAENCTDRSCRSTWDLPARTADPVGG